MPFKDWDDGLSRGDGPPVFFSIRDRFAALSSLWGSPTTRTPRPESHAPDRSDAEVIPRDPNADRDDGDAMLHTEQATSWRLVAYFYREDKASAARAEAYRLGAYGVALLPLDVNGDPVGPNG